MKKNWRNWVGCIVTCTIIFCMVSSLNELLRPTETDVSTSAIENFHNLPENTLEVIGYGSSHMWLGMDPMVMYEEFGIGAYNYGCNWQKLNTTLLFLKDSLRTQSPKIALIEMFFINGLLVDTDMDAEIYYTREIPGIAIKHDYLRQCFGDNPERYLSYVMPLCAFHDNWTNITEASFTGRSVDRGFAQSMGFLGFAGATPITIEDPSSVEQYEIWEDYAAVLDEMIAICKENDIEVILYTAPWEGTNPHSDALSQYAEDNGCVYFDFFKLQEEMGLDCEKDFVDRGHLNQIGAGKLARFLGKYIADNYDITDMRTIEGNLWEQALQAGDEAQ